MKLTDKEKKVRDTRMQEKSLLDQLTEYGALDYAPFHMPGHKRETSLGITSFPNPFSVDITEIDGFDNLHHAEGILKASMERAAEIYGTDRTWYLVNGSTCGILSAICAVTKPGNRILMARNCHKSAYHAVMLKQLDPVFLYPEEVEEENCPCGILGSLAPEKVEQILKEEPGIKAVFLTSPTYEGVVSDVAAIAEAVHRHGIPLIVDEAHGAHFPFGEEFPASAVECGADVVIQSLHKTLPSLTQTAILHLKSRLVTAAQLERYLPVFQSSSPSYVFLAVMENCVSYMNGEGRERMRTYAARLREFRKEAKKLRFLRVLDDEICGKNGVYARDPSKIVILAPGGSFNGTKISELLRENYHLEPEMSCSSYVILMTSLMDTEKNFSRLVRALKEMDASCAEKKGSAAEAAAAAQTVTWLEHPVRRMALSEAWDSERREVPLSQAEGLIAGSFVTVYPPGVPMLVPGEEITAEAIRLIQENVRLGLTVEGIRMEKEVQKETAQKDVLQERILIIAEK